MIQFNNYPPEKAGDVEFTQAAKSFIYDASQNHSVNPVLNRINANKLFAYGEAVGLTILASIDYDGAFDEIVEPLNLDVEEIASFNRLDFRTGVQMARRTTQRYSQSEGVQA